MSLNPDWFHTGMPCYDQPSRATIADWKSRARAANGNLPLNNRPSRLPPDPPGPPPLPHVTRLWIVVLRTPRPGFWRLTYPLAVQPRSELNTTPPTTNTTNPTNAISI